MILISHMLCVVVANYYHHFYYILDCEPQLGELDAKTQKAPVGKIALQEKRKL